jgi:hypothetical protein
MSRVDWKEFWDGFTTYEKASFWVGVLFGGIIFFILGTFVGAGFR